MLREGWVAWTARAVRRRGVSVRLTKEVLLNYRGVSIGVEQWIWMFEKGVCIFTSAIRVSLKDSRSSSLAWRKSLKGKTSELGSNVRQR